MSLENAILELAAAMRDQAVAVNAQAAASRELLASYNSRYAGGAAVAEVTKNTGVQPDAELENAVKKIEADAKKSDARTASAESPGTVTGADGVQADAGKSDAGAAGQTPPADTAGSAKESAGTEPLDYEKDVKPVLIKLAGAKGKAEMTALVTSFGVAKATELKGEQLAQIVDLANAMMA